MSRVTTERVRALLAGDLSPGPWTWRYRYDEAAMCRAIECHARYEEEQRVAETCSSSDDDAALIAAAPDLAADLIDARAALDADAETYRRSADLLTAERDAHRTRADAADADRDALRAENARLRAIVEGSATPPTDAEIDAHWRVGGAWLVSGSVVTGAYEVRRLASLGIAHLTWVPLSGTLHGRTPCPWPVTP